MRYHPEQCELTRTRIVQSARALFNRYGFEAVSIDGVMAHAGLTRGGFYRHFRTKGELYTAALEDALQQLMHSFPRDCSAQDIGQTLIEAYLSQQHLEEMDVACPLVTLPNDVARADPAVKRVFESIFLSMADLFKRSLQDSGSGEGAERALAVTALCVGSMTICRGLGDGQLGDAVRAAARRLAFEVCGLDGASSGTQSPRKFEPRRARPPRT